MGIYNKNKICMLQ